MSSLSDAEGRQPHRRWRVAFFGGSFDPPHLGHIEVARAAQAALGLDAVLFAPVGEQPLKPQGSTAAFAHRLAMTRLAIAGDPAFAVSLADAPKPSGTPNYTFDTLLTLRAQLPPDGVLFCLLGADAFALLRRWHRAAEIPFVAPLIVASRPGEDLVDLKAYLPEGLMIEVIPAADEMDVVDHDSSHWLCQGTTSKPALSAAEWVSQMQQNDRGALAPGVRSSSYSQIEIRRLTLSNPSGQQAPFYLLPGLDIDISASEIRDHIRAQTQQPTQLPDSVSDYIRAHSLYL
ncbi:MAG: nicotinate-nucleotide adenylyltransferase [Terracidiphilus sp.]